MSDYLLSFITFLPLAVSLLILALPDKQQNVYRMMTLAGGVVQLMACIGLWMAFDTLGSGQYADSFQFVQKARWITFSLSDSYQFSIDYHVGIDGIGLVFVALTSFIMLLATISSWNQSQQPKGYFVLFNLLNMSIVGCFVALDFFLFYLFFELMLLPMFFLIGIWGGPRRAYASVKFFLYTLLGSVFILIAMIGLYISVTEPGTETNTFNLIYLMDTENFRLSSLLHPDSGQLIWGQSPRVLAFVLLLIGFAIKLPVVPVHTWLPDAHVEAPTAISVVLAGLLLKVGGYGIFRFAYGVFPDVAVGFSVPIAFFGMLSVLYGGLNALAQRDFKRMIAYSSVSHMGFVLLGLASITLEGLSGSVFHMVSHGLISAGLFLIAGVIYDRTGDRRIENYSGLARKLPGYTFVVVLIFFASLGLPGLSGFVGEILIFLGTFTASIEMGSIPRWIAVMAVLGVIVSATYYLWTLQRMFFGNFWIRKEEWLEGFTDLKRREWLLFVPLMLLILLLGIYPKFILDVMNSTITEFQDFIIRNSK